MIVDEGLEPEAYPHSFEIRPSGPNERGDGHRGEGGCGYAPRYAQVRGGFSVTYIAVILGVQTCRIRTHLEQNPDRPDCLRVRNVPVI